jgi:hypothetical protein
LCGPYHWWMVYHQRHLRLSLAPTQLVACTAGELLKKGAQQFECVAARQALTRSSR